MASAKGNPAASRGNVNQIFTGKVFALYGNFGEAYPHATVARWITYHGGVVRADVESDTNILICGVDDYKKSKKPETINKARGLGSRCKIVTIDWLLDCCAKKKDKGQLLPIKAYELKSSASRLRAALAKCNGPVQRYATDGKSFEKLADPTRYHIYTDQTNFKLKIRLVRVAPAETVFKRGSMTVVPSIEKYDLFLLESNALPNTYMFGAKYHKGSQSGVHIDQCYDMQFSDAFAALRSFFTARTRVAWDHRLDIAYYAHPHWKYEPPAPGLPRGLLPVGWVEVGARPEAHGAQEKPEMTVEEEVLAELHAVYYGQAEDGVRKLQEMAVARAAAARARGDVDSAGKVFDVL